MSKYTPDCWELVEVVETETSRITYKIIAGWYGGFGGSDSWKLSSGIKEVIEHEDFYEMPQWSGSTYYCHKGARRIGGYVGSVLVNMQQRLKESGVGVMAVLENADPATLDYN